MSVAIAGMGWVTPLGSEVAGVWGQLSRGETAKAQSISSPLGRSYSALQVPAEAIAQSVTQSRLRRASAISRFAVAASLAAVQDAGLSTDPDTMSRMALVFAVSNGGVIYTRRFYDEIVEAGARAASPLLFPETVFNAPASHLAAILGITGATYTLVGDGACGILALQMAEELMGNDRLDHCLVVGAEETDWLLCDAYQKWRLLRANPPIEPFQVRPRGTTLSEGAGALLLSREGTVQIEKIAAGTHYRKRSEAGDAVEKVLALLCENEIDLVLASANGTFIDAAERAAIQRYCPATQVLAIKAALGESVGASSLWQTIGGAQSLLTQLVPPSLVASLGGEMRIANRSDNEPFRRAVISVCGLNQQVAGLTLVKK